MAKRLMSRVQVLSSLAMMKDAIAGTDTSSEGLYKFAFHAHMPGCRHPPFFGAAAAKAA